MTQNSLIPPPPAIPFNSLDSINYTGAVSFPFLSASRPPPPLCIPSPAPPGPIPAALCRPVEQPCLNPSDRDHPRVVSRDTGVYQGKPLSRQVKVTGNRHPRHFARSANLADRFDEGCAVLPGTKDSYLVLVYKFCTDYFL